MPDRYDDGSWGPEGDPQIAAADVPTQQLNDLNAQIQASPVFQQWIAAHHGGRDLSDAEKADLLQTLNGAGFRLDPNLRIGDDASVEPINHDARNLILVASMLAPLALPGSGAAGAATTAGGTTSAAYGPLASGYAGLGTAGATGAAVPTSLASGSTLATVGGAAGGASAVAPTTITGLTTPGVGTIATTPGVTATAGGSGMGLWSSLLGGTKGQLINAGLNLAGNYLQSRQVDKATQAQVDAANKALDLQRNVYMQQRADLSPFADVGRGAVSDLARMTGTTPASSTTLPMFQPPDPNVAPTMVGPNGSPAPHDGNPNNAPVVGQAVPRSTLSTIGGGYVNMIAPDGRLARVPSAQVQQALQAGGRMA